MSTFYSDQLNPSDNLYRLLQQQNEAGQLYGELSGAQPFSTLISKAVFNASNSGGTGSGNVTASANFGTNNAIIKSDGTGKGVQSTGVVIDGSNNISNVETLTAASVVTPAIAISGSHSSNETYHGITLTGMNAGAAISQWDAVYLGSSSTWLVADANGSGTYPARGLAISGYSSGNAATVLIAGSVRHDAWNWTPGGTIYISTTAGGLTQTAPSTSGDKVQQVGFALTADNAFFNFASGEYATVT